MERKDLRKVVYGKKGAPREDRKEGETGGGENRFQLARPLVSEYVYHSGLRVRPPNKHFHHDSLRRLARLLRLFNY